MSRRVRATRRTRPHGCSHHAPTHRCACSCSHGHRTPYSCCCAAHPSTTRLTLPCLPELRRHVTESAHRTAAPGRPAAGVGVRWRKHRRGRVRAAGYWRRHTPCGQTERCHATSCNIHVAICCVLCWRSLRSHAYGTCCTTGVASCCSSLRCERLRRATDHCNASRFYRCMPATGDRAQALSRRRLGKIGGARRGACGRPDAAPVGPGLGTVDLSCLPARAKNTPANLLNRPQHCTRSTHGTEGGGHRFLTPVGDPR